MSTLIVAAPRILEFEKTNESIAFRIQESGKKSLTLINDNELFYNTSHINIQNDIARFPKKNLLINHIENILQIFFKTRYQNILYTSGIILGKKFKEKINQIDEISRQIPSIIKDEKDLEFYVDQIGDKNLFEPIHSQILTQFSVTELNESTQLKKEFLTLNLKEFYRYYFLVEEAIKKYNIDQIVIYNGRQIRYSAAYNSAKNMGLKNISFYESSSTIKDSYIIFNNPVHKLRSLSNDIKKSKNNSGRLDLTYIYISKRFSGGSFGVYPNFQKNRFLKTYTLFWKEFYKDIKRKKIVSIFTSSEFEKNSLKENRSFTLNKTSLEDFENIMKKNLIPSNYKIILRVHPHLAGYKSDNNYQKKFEDIAKKYNVLYIGSNVPVDSYKLLLASDLCISFGSTIGAEAALLRKKSLSIGVGLHDKFNCVFTPKSYKEIEEFIKLKVSEDYLNDKQAKAIEYFNKLYSFSIPYPKNISSKFKNYLLLKRIFFYPVRRYYRLKEFFYCLFMRDFRALSHRYEFLNRINLTKNDSYKKPLYE